ncbi:MAG: NTP transferase domain-containing protein [Rhodospirillales bacterium]|nr:NTP transferase domain-containing protein [Rhodospirillales bacterium]
MSSDWHDCKAYILAGGRGSRLKTATSIPKVIAPVNGRPFIHFLLDMLENAGVEEAVVCTGFAAQEVEAAVNSWNGSVRIEFSREKKPLGTGGAIKNALRDAPSKTMLILNGDSIADVDLTAFLTWHRDRESPCSILLSQIDDVSRYGNVILDDHDRIISFSEKKGEGSGLVNAGIYLLESVYFNNNSPDEDVFSFEVDFIAVQKANTLTGCAMAKCFIDIGIPSTYDESGSFFSN